ncbi:MAG: type II toxin-antitoxin system HipA family toxin, partial [Azovibrio sp.]
GIHMAECRLLRENSRAHFMTRRFDRDTGGYGHRSQKYHLQTLCAMQHLDYRLWAAHSYRQYFETILELILPESALVEGYRRMVFNVMAANCDDHTKNLSFLMDPAGRWHLAPAYDINYACIPGDRKGCPHLMSVNDKFCDITLADLEREGERFMVPDYGRVIEEVAQATERWPEFAKQAGLSPAEAVCIQEDFLRV